MKSMKDLKTLLRKELQEIEGVENIEIDHRILVVYVNPAVTIPHGKIPNRFQQVAVVTRSKPPQLA